MIRQDAGRGALPRDRRRTSEHSEQGHLPGNPPSPSTNDDLHGHAAIHGQDLARDVLCFWTRDKGHGGRHILALAKSA